MRGVLTTENIETHCETGKKQLHGEGRQQGNQGNKSGGGGGGGGVINNFEKLSEGEGVADGAGDNAHCDAQ